MRPDVSLRCCSSRIATSAFRVVLCKDCTPGAPRCPPKSRAIAGGAIRQTLISPVEQVDDHPATQGEVKGCCAATRHVAVSSTKVTVKALPGLIFAPSIIAGMSTPSTVWSCQNYASRSLVRPCSWAFGSPPMARFSFKRHSFLADVIRHAVRLCC